MVVHRRFVGEKPLDEVLIEMLKEQAKREKHLADREFEKLCNDNARKWAEYIKERDETAIIGGFSD